MNLRGVTQRLRTRRVVFRHLGEHVQRRHQLAVILGELVRRQQRPRRVLARRSRGQHALQRGERIRIRRALAEDVRVAAHRLRLVATRRLLEQLRTLELQPRDLVGVTRRLRQGHHLRQRLVQLAGAASLLVQLGEPRQVLALLRAVGDRRLERLGGLGRAARLGVELHELEQQLQPLRALGGLDALAQQRLRVRHTPRAPQQPAAAAAAARASPAHAERSLQRVPSRPPTSSSSSARVAASEKSCTATASSSDSVASRRSTRTSSAWADRSLASRTASARLMSSLGSSRSARTRQSKAARLSASCFSWMLASRRDQPLARGEVRRGVQLLLERGHLPLMITRAAVVRGQRLGDLRRLHARRRQPLQPAHHQARGHVLRQQAQEELRRVLAAGPAARRTACPGAPSSHCAPSASPPASPAGPPASRPPRTWTAPRTATAGAAAAPAHPAPASRAAAPAAPAPRERVPAVSFRPISASSRARGSSAQRRHGLERLHGLLGGRVTRRARQHLAPCRLGTHGIRQRALEQLRQLPPDAPAPPARAPPAPRA